jgi:hypothetical protein
MGTTRIVLLVAAQLFAGSTWANCDQLTNDDARWLCKAKTENKVRDCDSIMNPDDRWFCKATVGGRSGDCSSIQDTQLRTYCRSAVR